MIITLALALTAPSAEAAPVSSCDRAITEQIGGNSLELGTGSNACEDEGREDDAEFLAVLARLRASADMILLPPANPLELSRSSDFREVFADQGKFVDEELARDPERFAALLDRVRNADLSIPTEYDPGWVAGEGDKRALYAEVIDGLRTDALAMESYIARLVRDEAYFSAYLERVAILANLSESGQKLPERFGEVANIMKSRIDVLGDPPTETAVLWRKVYEPGPNAPFTVLHRGFDGPARKETRLFRSPTDVRQSWIGVALTQGELSHLLSRIDFDHEILGVYAVGEMPNATENLFVTEFGPQKDFDGFSIAVRLGVAGGHCGFGPSRSYPFVLVKVSSQEEGEVNSTSRSNYPDRCAPVMAGKPSSLADPD